MSSAMTPADQQVSRLRRTVLRLWFAIGILICGCLLFAAGCVLCYMRGINAGVARMYNDVVPLISAASYQRGYKDASDGRAANPEMMKGTIWRK
jgi:hypothetical protein